MTDEAQLGTPVPDWKVPPLPPLTAIEGTLLRLEPLCTNHVR